MSRPKRIAIVGAGKWGRNRTIQLQELGVEICAVCDIDSNASQTLIRDLNVDNISSYQDLESLINHELDLDGFACFTDPLSRGEMLPLLLSSGKALYLEKPICANKNQLIRAKELYIGLDQKPIICTGNAGRSPAYQVLREKLNTSEFGKLRALHISHGWQWNYFDKKTWRSSVEMGGGHLNEKLIHQFEALVWAIGPAVAVRAMGVPSLNNADICDNNISVIIESQHSDVEGPILMHSSFGTRGPRNMESFEIMFEKAHIDIFISKGYFWMVVDDDEPVKIGNDRYWWPIHNLRSFADRLNGQPVESQTSPGFEYSIDALELVFSIRKLILDHPS